MNLQNLCFERKQMFFDLPQAAHNAIVSQGVVDISGIVGTAYQNEYVADLPQSGDICLASRHDIELLDFDEKTAAEKIHELLNETFSVRYQYANGVHQLIKTMNNSLLTAVQQEFAKHKHEKTGFNMKKYDVYDPIEAADGHYRDGRLYVSPETKSYAGMMSICTCGYAACFSAYALIEEFELLIYLEGAGEGFSLVKIFPEYLQGISD